MEDENPQQKLKSKPPRGRKWWEAQISKCQQSGMTMVAYAEKNNLSLANLYHWKSILNREEKAEGKQKTGEPQIAKQLKFVELSLNGAKAESLVEIVAPNGWSIRVKSDVHAETVTRFMNVIERRS